MESEGAVRAKQRQQDTLRKYLLGELDEPARLVLDEQVVTDPATFDALALAEQALIDEYVDAGLSRADRAAFERQIRTLPQVHEKVRFARQLRVHAIGAEPAANSSSRVIASDGSSRLGRLLPSGMRWAEHPFWMAAAVLVLAALVGGNVWLARRQAAQAGQLAQLTAQHEQDRSRLQESSAAIRDLQARLASTERASAQIGTPRLNPIPTAVPSPIFVLATGLLRSEGQLARVSIPEGAKVIRLQLPVAGADRREYRAVLFDAEGEECWTIAKLHASGTPAAVVMTVAVDLLPPGDYRLQLMGAGEPATPVHTYSFRVVSR
jgi:hypothetical protein